MLREVVGISIPKCCNSGFWQTSSREPHTNLTRTCLKVARFGFWLRIEGIIQHDMAKNDKVFQLLKLLSYDHLLKAWSNEDESWWELRSESSHESSLNSHAPVKWGESWWELRNECLHESSLNSHAPVKRGESRWELRSESLHESSLNSHAPVKRGESVRVEKREFAREFSQLSCARQTRWELMRVEKRVFAREFSQLSCAGQTRWELMRVMTTPDVTQSLKQSL